MVTLGEILRWFVYTAERLYDRVAIRLLRRDKLVVGSEKRFRALLENAPDAIVIVDHHGHISLVNAQAERLFGYRRDELLGQAVTDLVPERDRLVHWEHQKAYSREPSSRPMGSDQELFGRRKDGTEFPVEISLGPLHTERGLLISAVVRDVSERKRIEAELKRRATALERSNGDLEQFAYVASHDLQAPLRVIAGFTQILQRRYEGQLDDDADDLMERTIDSVKRMQRLVEDLLAYSRVSRHEGAPEAVDCGAAVDQVLRVLAEDIANSGAEISVGALPAVAGTPTQIEQVFQNLIGNALKFSNAENPKVDVQAAPGEHEMWRFEIRDNGIGIDPAHAERIFKMFQRLHGPDDFPGTGIGLAICKRIIEERGGEIRADPAPSGGTVFSFTLPSAEPRSRTRS